jgi:hypothetical protein
MLRRLMPFCLVLLMGPDFAARTAGAQPPSDPWCGTYLKLGGWRPSGQDGLAPYVTITRDGEGYYRLNEPPYQSSRFIEVEKGVLEDREKGLGKIYLGSVQYVAGRRQPETMLKAEFCYDGFYLLGR